MPSLRRRTSFITRPSPTTVSQALTEVDKARSVSTPTWRSSRRRHLRVLYENDQRRGADRPFGVYHLLYLREGDRTRLTLSSRASPPALTALTACGAICTALHGLGQPKALQPHGAHTSNLDACLRPCRAREDAARSGRLACIRWVRRSRGAFPIRGRCRCRRGCSGLCFVPAWSHICTSVTV